MTIAEYNAYIKNYLDNDKTKSAIMLTAPWGMGKSYYIQNSLIPYLNGFERKTCIVVSLYGMKDTGEISKSIYLELRMKQLKKIGEKTNTGLLAAKTLVKGVAGFFGIGLDINSKDLEKLYSSVNLSGKLIILEDLERTDIDIKQILGYVNNLVEQDGVKVLLVANESAILKYREEPGRDKDGNEIKTKVLSQESQEYLTIKEKTVSDTILFICDFSEAIKNILKQFDNEHINACLSADEQGLILEIQDIMTKIGEYNLRSLLFACQKVADIYNYCHETVNSDYFRTVFLSAVAFSLRLKRNDKLEWSKDMTADKLGTTKYPLYRYCYDYIKYQEFDVFEIKETEKAFIEQEEAKRTQKDIYDKLNVLFWYSTYSQAKIESVLSDIREILYGGNSILLDECGKLAYHLIAVRGLVDCSTVIDDCKCALLQLLSKGNYDARKITLVMGMYGSAKFWTDEQKSEYSDFINEIKDTIKKHDIEPISKQCSVENFANMLDSLCNEKEKYISQHAFFSRVNVDQWIELLPQLSSDQIYKLRETLDYIYSFSNIKDFFSTDKESLIYFKNGVESVIGSDVIKDKILKLQYKFLLDDLTSIIGKL